MFSAGGLLVQRVVSNRSPESVKKRWTVLWTCPQHAITMPVDGLFLKPSTDS